MSGLLRSRRFFPLFWTQFFGAFNDNLFKNALVLGITYQGVQVFGVPPSQMVALSGGLFILPFFLFSATAGQLADKYEKAKLIRFTKWLELGIMGIGAYGLLSARFEFLMAVLFLMGLQSTLFGPLKYSILPQHLSREEILSGNAQIEAGTFLAILLGTLAAGILASAPHGSLWVSIGVVLVAVAGLGLSYRIPSAPSQDPALHVHRNPFSPSLELYRFARKSRPVYLSILGISWFWALGSAILSILPSFTKEVLGAEASVVTLLLALFSLGVGVGSLLCEKLSRHILELGLVPLGSFGISLFCGDLYFASSNYMQALNLPLAIEPTTLVSLGQFLKVPGALRILFDLSLLSVSSGFFLVPLYTLIQVRSEERYRSRIVAANNVLNAFFMVASAGALMLLLKFGATLPQIFLIFGIFNLLASLYIYSLLPEFFIRFVVWILANVLYRLQVRGIENLPREGAALLISNHVSFVDWMIIGAAVPRPTRFIMDHQFARGWFTRLFLKQGKVILIATAKEDPELLKRALDQAVQALKDGEVVCLFPEGVITRDGKMSSFRPGIERILERVQVPIVPMALHGLWGSFFSREGGQAIKKVPKRFWSRIVLKIGPQLPPEGQTAASLESVVRAMVDPKMP